MIQIVKVVVCIVLNKIHTSSSCANIARVTIRISSTTILSKSESVKFPQIKSVICLLTDSPVTKYISLLNQLIITD